MKFIKNMIEERKQSKLAKLEQERLLEIERQEQIRQEKLRQEQELKRQYELKMKKLEEDKPKILASKVPVGYMIMFQTECKGKELASKEYVYPRYDLFVCDRPRKGMCLEYYPNECNFKKVSGDHLGEIFTSDMYDEVHVICYGKCYTLESGYPTDFSIWRNRTIEELNEWVEDLNKTLKQQCRTYIYPTKEEEKIKNNLFDL